MKNFIVGIWVAFGIIGLMNIITRQGNGLYNLVAVIWAIVLLWMVKKEAKNA